MEKEIKIKFIYHSCYTMEFEDYILIFDYFQGELPKNPKNKKLIFISTHSHYDHFTKKILEIGNPEENIYILSSDIQDLLQKDNIPPSTVLSGSGSVPESVWLQDCNSLYRSL